MISQFAVAALACLPLVTAQQLGTPDKYPQLPIMKCTTGGGCELRDAQLVLDSGAHPLEEVSSGQSCYASTGGLNSTICATPESCGQNCAWEDVDYAAQGVTTDGNSLTMRQWIGTKSVSPRIYLLNRSGKEYRMLNLLNQEFTFTVDMSNLPCGMNAALYLSEMEKDGGRNALNPAGASKGTGYCDAQCYQQTFTNGVMNNNSVGSCCSEMDIWEANARATGFTPHPCNVTSFYGCTGAECEFDGVCDKWGCGYNPYALGEQDYYGQNSSFTLDSNIPFTVVTRFVTTDNTFQGTLKEIRRLYIQNGNVIQNAVVAFGDEEIDSLTIPYCSAADSRYNTVGGMTQMGKALKRGMVLIFAIWNDVGGFMNWLDSGNAGPCNATEGNPTQIFAENPGTSVTWSDIRWGDIGSTVATA